MEIGQKPIIIMSIGVARYKGTALLHLDKISFGQK
jgi:hypothetical protein